MGRHSRAPVPGTPASRRTRTTGPGRSVPTARATRFVGSGSRPRGRHARRGRSPRARSPRERPGSKCARRVRTGTRALHGGSRIDRPRRPPRDPRRDARDRRVPGTPSVRSNPSPLSCLRHDGRGARRNADPAWKRVSRRHRPRPRDRRGLPREPPSREGRRGTRSARVALGAAPGKDGRSERAKRL